jgi:CRP/FNR family transcriptional regulator, dissimilatory nitrate respiration regulator
MTSSLDVIGEIALFDGLPVAQLEEVKKIAVQRDFDKGDAIFFEGDKANGFYVVSEGLVKIFKISLEGKEQILHIFGPGEPIGEVPVFAGQDFPANAQAIAKSRLVFFPRNAFIGLIIDNPSLALNMLAVLSMRLRKFTVQVEHLSLKEVPGRLAVYLLYLSDAKGGQPDVNIGISKTHLSGLLGTIPETLSRILAKMTKKGLIQVNGRRIRIEDRQGLNELAQTGKGLA